MTEVVSAMALSDRHFPAKPSRFDILERSKDKGLSYAEAECELEFEYRKDKKAELQEAMSEYAWDTDSVGGERFLAEILCEMLDMI